MSLTNRLSLFFLVALAAVLCGFSGILYALANRHLHVEDEQRLHDAMRTLVAAIEVHAADVEWEPLERKVTLGEDPATDQVRWSVHDASGRLIDCSENLEHPAADSPPLDRGWRVLVRRVRAGRFEPEPHGERNHPFLGAYTDGFSEGELPANARMPENRTHVSQGLILTVASAEEPTESMLSHLAIAMAGVSAGILLMAAITGRWLCRRALHPIARMADSARTIRGQKNSPPFLDVAATGDELEGLGREFNALLGNLRESLERQQRFTGDASHQLRTPLTALLASVEVALKRDRSPAEYQRVLEVVQRRGLQLRHIVESLLFLARAESGAPLDFEPIDLNDWCRGRIESWSDHPRAADIAVSTGVPVVVRTHQALLGQVLDNLLDNACKYSPAGSPIAVTVSRNDFGAIVSVADAGCGIAAEECDRVFEPFFRSSQARWLGSPGVGLGLTIAERLAATLGGRIEVRSQLGQGSLFRMVLPVDSSPKERSLLPIGSTARVDEFGK
ncbi:MAG TPA: HAMP domain-containing sensor histidine kinase [Urbifossiella sp.]|nr:HAMP domain-containing sensor histidine kinase [Urbifossiella sp.]